VRDTPLGPPPAWSLWTVPPRRLARLMRWVPARHSLCVGDRG